MNAILMAEYGLIDEVVRTGYLPAPTPGPERS
jgi:hypothetical protein